MADALQGRSSKANREAKRGIMLILVLLMVFIFVAYRRYSGKPEPAGPSTAMDPDGTTIDPSTDAGKTENVLRPTQQADEFRSPTVVDQQPGSFQPAYATGQPQTELPNYLPNPLTLDSGESWKPIAPPQAPVAVPVEHTTAYGDTPKTVEPAVFDDPDEPQRALPDTTSRPISETVRDNDSFWLISQRAYGSGTYFRALYEHNRSAFPQPDRLPAGAEVELPPLDELQRKFPSLCPPKVNDAASAAPPVVTQTTSPPPQRPTTTRTYVTREGDSVFDIARFQLGQASRYVEVLQLNAEQLNDQLEDLPRGLKLQIPRE